MISILAFITLAFSSHLFAESGKPEFKIAEVKVTYPCGALDTLEKDDEEEDVVSFFDWEDRSFYKAGYIFRKRAKGVTLKFRAASVQIKNSIYEEIEGSHTGDLKCEIDVTSVQTESCSYEAPVLEKEHYLFLEMIKGPRPTFNPDQMKPYSAKVSSWKVILPQDKLMKNPFQKRPSLEMWVKGDGCRLEISGKLQFRERSIEKGIEFLKSLTPVSPSLNQSSKTSWILGLEV